jgi:hypothetical protein
MPHERGRIGQVAERRMCARGETREAVRFSRLTTSFFSRVTVLRRVRSRKRFAPSLRRSGSIFFCQQIDTRTSARPAPARSVQAGRCDSVLTGDRRTPTRRAF